MFDTVDHLAVNTVRTFSADMIQEAHSGNLGLSIGAAPMAYVLWSKYLKVNPKQSNWENRDRFVLSKEYGSTLLNVLLYLSGFNGSVELLKQVHQIPEQSKKLVIEDAEGTTEVIGQGLEKAIKMAMEERELEALYNRDGFPVVDYYTYALCGDEELTVGLSDEAAALAGNLKLHKLVVLYDSKDPFISKTMEARFQSLGWNYLRVADGNQLDAIAEAIEDAQCQQEKPTLLEVTNRTINATNQLTEKNEIDAFKKTLNWPYEPFVVPDEVAHRFDKLLVQTGEQEYQDWIALFEAYRSDYPELAQQFQEKIESNE